MQSLQTYHCLDDIDALYDHNWLNIWRKIAKDCGIESKCDLQQMLPYIEDASYIMEIGGGSGRVIDFILAHNSQCFITAIEKSLTLYSHLQDKYQLISNISLIHGDILKPLSGYLLKHDLVLIAWGLITKFTGPEINCIFNNVRQILTPKGRILLELPSNTAHLQQLQQSYKTNLTINTLGEKDLQIIATKNKLVIDETICYTTMSGNERLMYVLVEGE